MTMVVFGRKKIEGRMREDDHDESRSIELRMKDLVSRRNEEDAESNVKIASCDRRQQQRRRRHLLR